MLRAILSLFKWIGGLAAVLLILLAVVVGMARLLLPQIPEYTDQIRGFVLEATGVQLTFREISAVWPPLAGPELRFYGVTLVLPGDGGLISAQEARVGFSITRLVLERQVVISSVGLRGSSLDVRRTEEGLLFQGVNLKAFSLPGRDSRELQLPRLNLDLRDIRLSYTDDNLLDSNLQFRVDRLRAGLEPRRLRASGNIETRVGEELELSADWPVAAGSVILPDPELPGRVSLIARELDLARALTLVAGSDAPLESARADHSLAIQLEGGEPSGLDLDYDIQEALISGGESWERLRGRVEWEKQEGGWIVAGSDLQARDLGLGEAASEFTLRLRQNDQSGIAGIDFQTTYFNFEDVYPLARTIAWQGFRDTYLPDYLRGELTEFGASFDFGETPVYRAQGSMTDFSMAMPEEGVMLVGLNGEFDLNEAGGRFQVVSPDLQIRVPLFREALAAVQVDGLVVWRASSRGISVLSDGIRMLASGLDLYGSLEAEFPADGGLPLVDITATGSLLDGSLASQFLPTTLPPKVMAWLDRALVAGRVPSALFTLSGPLDRFPFLGGEGVFRVELEVEDGLLDYADGWPAVESMNGPVVFEGPGLSISGASGRVAGVPVKDVQARIPDLRRGLMELELAQDAALPDIFGLLKLTPVANALGPVLQDVTAAGEVIVDARLDMPVTRPREYQLDVRIDTTNAEVGLRTLDQEFTELRGQLTLANTQLSAEGLKAKLLGQPVNIDVRPATPEEAGYSHVATVAGATPADAAAEAVKIPFPDRLSGDLNWNALARIPGRSAEGSSLPLEIEFSGDLGSVVSAFPAPLQKAGGETQSLTARAVFPAEGEFEIEGALQRRDAEDIGFILGFAKLDSVWSPRTGAIHLGDLKPVMPREQGLEITGQVRLLRFEDWLQLGSEVPDSGQDWTRFYRTAELDIADLRIAGWQFNNISLDVLRDPPNWRISLDGEEVEGDIVVPLNISGGTPVVLDLARLYLLEQDEREGGRSDPRDLPPVVAEIEDFHLQSWHFGSLVTALSRVPGGLVADRIRAESDSFLLEGEGSWLVPDPLSDRQQSRVELNLSSTNVASTLSQLGFDAVIDSPQGSFAAELSWPGPPDAQFGGRSTGSVSMQVDNGELKDLEPGGGRILGLLSVGRLPQRLALDFSDVFSEGLEFETLGGDFDVRDGQALTCNLALKGDVTDMAIVGRADAAARTYDQVVVLRPHVSNMLPIGGALLAGPQVGAAILVLQQIFKRPLSEVGRSYYHITGSWDEPAVERVSASNLNAAPFEECSKVIDAEGLLDPETDG